MSSNNHIKVDLLRTINESTTTSLRVEALIGLRLLDNIPLSQTVLTTLKSALNDPLREIRIEATMTLSFLFKEDAVSLIMSLCSDDDPRVRSSVIAGLSYIGNYDDRIKRFLKECLSDPSDDIRDRAARAFGRLGATDMISKLREIAFEDQSELVKSGAIIALGMLNYPGMIEILEPFLEFPETSIMIKFAILEYLEQFK
ncbi:MAG: HEAT repeat domain-containing protein [Candidatus Hodarchaeales archaeon]|jgi:HEAT repeat protein